VFAGSDEQTVLPDSDGREKLKGQTRIRHVDQLLAEETTVSATYLRTMAMVYKNCTTCTNFLSCGRLTMTTV